MCVVRTVQGAPASDIGLSPYGLITAVPPRPIPNRSPSLVEAVRAIREARSHEVRMKHNLSCYWRGESTADPKWEILMLPPIRIVRMIIDGASSNIGGEAGKP